MAAGIFKALADPARVRLLSAIAAGSEDGICVCELTEPLNLSQPTVSHHLKVLFEAGLVGRERRGTWVYYTLRGTRSRSWRGRCGRRRALDSGAAFPLRSRGWKQRWRRGPHSTAR